MHYSKRFCDGKRLNSHSLSIVPLSDERTNIEMRKEKNYNINLELSDRVHFFR